jgi:hypothetical protein
MLSFSAKTLEEGVGPRGGNGCHEDSGGCGRRWLRRPGIQYQKMHLQPEVRTVQTQFWYLTPTRDFVRFAISWDQRFRTISYFVRSAISCDFVRFRAISCDFVWIAIFISVIRNTFWFASTDWHYNKRIINHPINLTRLGANEFYYVELSTHLNACLWQLLSLVFNTNYFENWTVCCRKWRI